MIEVLGLCFCCQLFFSHPIRALSESVDEAIKLEVVLKIEPNVRIRTPIRALSESVVKMIKELPLADERFHRPATISLIPGADAYRR